MTEQLWVMTLDFNDQSPSFANGFTCGKIWVRMKLGEALIQETVLNENLPMIQRMADYHYYDFEAQDIDSSWASITLTKTPDDPVKRRLTVVEGGLREPGPQQTKGTV